MQILILLAQMELGSVFLNHSQMMLMLLFHGTHLEVEALAQMKLLLKLLIYDINI